MENIYNIVVREEVPSPIIIEVSAPPSPTVVTIDTAPVSSVNGKVGFVIINKADVGLSNVENLSILGVSGSLQDQIDSLDLNYATDADLSGLSGQLVSSDANLYQLIQNLSGYVDISDSGLSGLISSLSGSLNSSGSYLLYQIDSGNSGLFSQITGLSGFFTQSLEQTGLSLQGQIDDLSSSGFLTGFNSGAYVMRDESGSFYPSYNPNNYISGFNSGDYVQKSETGQFYASNNPLKFITLSALSPYLTGFNSGDYVLKSETGVLASSGSLYQSGYDLSRLISSTSGELQGQINNLDSGYATDAQLTGLSGFFAQNLEQTGLSLQNQVNGLDSGYDALSGNLNTSGFNLINLITGTSGDLQGQINDLSSSGFITGSPWRAEGYITGFNSGNYVAKSESGAFYPSYNPSRFITGFDSGNYLLKSETGVFASDSDLNQSGGFLLSIITGASGTLQSQINNLDSGYASQGELNALSGNLNTSGNTLWLRDSGISGALNESGSNLQQQITGLSGHLENDLSFAVYKTGDQTISGIKTFSNQINLSGLKFDLLNGAGLPTWAEGKVFYDSDAHTLCYYNDSSDVTVNIGQEHIIRVSNGWTGTITNGMVVYVSGALGNRPKIFPATATHTLLDSHDILGVATQDITNQGYVTLQGLVNGLNTNSYSEGDTLYLSTGLYGTYSTLMPDAPNHKVKIGIVTRSHTNQGQIFVKITQADHINDLNDIKINNAQSGDFLRYSEASGFWYNTPVNYYPDTNPSGFITGVDLSNYATTGNLAATGVNLQTQINEAKILSIAYAIAL